MAHRNFYNFHKPSHKHVCEPDKNLRNFHFYHFSAIAAVLEILDSEICLLLFLEILLLYIHGV